MSRNRCRSLSILNNLIIELVRKKGLEEKNVDLFV